MTEGLIAFSACGVENCAQRDGKVITNYCNSLLACLMGRSNFEALAASNGNSLCIIEVVLCT